MKTESDIPVRQQDVVEALSKKIGVPLGQLLGEWPAETLSDWESKCLEAAVGAMQIRRATHDRATDQLAKRQFRAAMSTLKRVRTAMRRK